MEERVKRPYKILATDIDETALRHAQEGRYRAHQVQSVPKPYLEKYFQVDADEWVIDPWLQRNVSFQQHNLLTDPFPTPLDLIICRNVLIYFTEEAKRSVVARCVAALKPGGFLFVGSTEQFLYAHEYALRCVSPFVYQKRR
jgi:chemotaxis protein methyltransferase CheR